MGEYDRVSASLVRAMGPCPDNEFGYHVEWQWSCHNLWCQWVGYAEWSMLRSDDLRRCPKCNWPADHFPCWIEDMEAE